MLILPPHTLKPSILEYLYTAGKSMFPMLQENVCVICVENEPRAWEHLVGLLSVRILHFLGYFLCVWFLTSTLNHGSGPRLHPALPDIPGTCLTSLHNLLPKTRLLITRRAELQHVIKFLVSWSFFPPHCFPESAYFSGPNGEWSVLYNSSFFTRGEESCDSQSPKQKIMTRPVFPLYVLYDLLLQKVSDNDFIWEAMFVTFISWRHSWITSTWPQRAKEMASPKPEGL